LTCRPSHLKSILTYLKTHSFTFINDPDRRVGKKMHSDVRIWEKKHKATCPNVTSHIWIDGNGAWMVAHGTWGHVVWNIALKSAIFRGSPTRRSNLTPGCPQNLRSIYDMLLKWHLEITSHTGLFWGKLRYHDGPLSHAGSCSHNSPGP